MSTQIELKSGLEANRTTITPALGEPLYTTDNRRLFIGDGATPGGIQLTIHWGDLADKPSFFSGDYVDLIGKPTLFSGSYVDLTNKPTYAAVALSGSYADLLNKPTLFSGSYVDLTNKPTLFSGAYADLTGAPALGSAATKNTGTAAGNIPVLDGAGKISSAMIPSVAITEVYVVADITARDALTVQTGDVAIVSSTSQSFIHDGTAWQLLKTPGAVSTVFGRTGAIVASTGDYTVAQVTGAAPIADPAFTGVPTAPTATVGTNTTQLATTAFVMANAGGSVSLDSPAFTGTPTAPTAASNNNSTQLATTAFVQSMMGSSVDSNTTALFHFENNLADNSASNITLTNIGGATFSSSIMKFGSYSATFSGTQYLSSTAIAAAKFAGDFTVELWFYPTNLSADRALFDTRNGTSTSTGFGIYTTGNSIRVDSNLTGNIVNSAGSITVNTWNHVALTRSGSTITCWLNGVSISTVTNSTNFSDGVLRFGANANASVYFIGNIDEARISNICRYTTTFTPQGTPFGTSNIAPTASPIFTGTPTAPTAAANTNSTQIATTAFVSTALGAGVDASTSLLLHMENNLNDSSGNNISLTNNNITFSSSTFRVGSYSAVFNGTNGYISSASTNNAFKFAGDFTVECWLYPTSVGATYSIIETRTGNNSTGLGIELVAGKIVISGTSGGSTMAAAGNIVANQWYHLAITRTGSTLTMWINGVAVNTVTNSTNFSDGNFRSGVNYAGNNPFVGFMDEYRFSQVCRYTSSFGPTTVPFGNPTILGVSGGTMTGSLKLFAQTETAVTNSAITGAYTIPTTAGTVFNYTLTGATTFTFGTPNSGAYEMTLVLKQGGSGSYTVTWPSSSTLKWAGSAPTLSTAVGATDIITVFTPDGITWYGTLIGKGYV